MQTRAGSVLDLGSLSSSERQQLRPTELIHRESTFFLPCYLCLPDGRGISYEQGLDEAVRRALCLMSMYESGGKEVLIVEGELRIDEFCPPIMLVAIWKLLNQFLFGTDIILTENMSLDILAALKHFDKKDLETYHLSDLLQREIIDSGKNQTCNGQPQPVIAEYSADLFCWQGKQFRGREFNYPFRWVEGPSLVYAGQIILEEIAFFCQSCNLWFKHTFIFGECSQVARFSDPKVVSSTWFCPVCSTRLADTRNQEYG